MAAAMDIMDRPFAWGCADCCTAACDVLAALFGVDPMARYRGRYSNRREAMAIIAAAGGWLPFAECAAEAAGLAPADDSHPGDIGVTAGPRRSLAVCVAPGAWAAKSPLGLALVAKVERAWRV
jgi:hypothetical protein